MYPNLKPLLKPHFILKPDVPHFITDPPFYHGKCTPFYNFLQNRALRLESSQRVLVLAPCLLLPCFLLLPCLSCVMLCCCRLKSYLGALPCALFVFSLAIVYCFGGLRLVLMSYMSCLLPYAFHLSLRSRVQRHNEPLSFQG
jgi:hypothetical protein